MPKRVTNTLYGRSFENQGLATSYAVSQSTDFGGIFYLTEQQGEFFVDQNDQLGKFDKLINKYQNGAIIP